jgi:hypothetical protein
MLLLKNRQRTREMTKELMSKRFEELVLAMDATVLPPTSRPGQSGLNTQQWHQWATSALHLLELCFGQDSVPYARLSKAIQNSPTIAFMLASSRGTFLAAKEDFDGGYVSGLAQGIAGEVFANLLNSARAALDEGYKDSAAVLASAAFEDSLKKISALHGLPVAEAELGNVIGALKAQQLLQGGSAKSAERFQNLRNWAMHANWPKITAEEVGSLIGFVEQLLLKHLS